MSSQQVHQAHRLEAVDTSGQASRFNARSKPRLLTDQDPDAFMNKSLTADEVIEVCRQRLSEVWCIAFSRKQELDDEREVRLRCAEAYQTLYTQFFSLYNELHESWKAISDRDLAFERFQHSVTAEKAQLRDTIKNIEGTKAELEQALDKLKRVDVTQNVFIKRSKTKRKQRSRHRKCKTS